MWHTPLARGVREVVSAGCIAGSWGLAGSIARVGIWAPRTTRSLAPRSWCNISAPVFQAGETAAPMAAGRRQAVSSGGAMAARAALGLREAWHRCPCLPDRGLQGRHCSLQSSAGAPSRRSTALTAAVARMLVQVLELVASSAACAPHPCAGIAGAPRQQRCARGDWRRESGLLLLGLRARCLHRCPTG